MRAFTLILFALLFAPLTTQAKEANNPPVRATLHDTHGHPLADFFPFGDKYFGRVSATGGDINNDQNDELFFGSGDGIDPLVKIFDQTGKELASFPAYSAPYNHGVNIATCDLDQDGQTEIITAPASGGGPHVKVFKADGTPWNSLQFFAYDSNFTGGVFVSCGDIDGDKVPEIITTPGITGGPHLKVFNSRGEMQDEIFVGAMPSNSGLQTTMADTNNDGRQEIIATQVEDGAHRLFTLTHDTYSNKLIIKDEFSLGDDIKDVYLHTFHYTPNETSLLINDSYTDPRTKIFSLNGKLSSTFPTFTNKDIGAQTLEIKNKNSALQLSVNDSNNFRKEDGQYILTDLSDQHMWAYEDGHLAMDFLVSTGIRGLETPLGFTQVLAKFPVHDYKWTYFGGPYKSYDIPDVKWNLQIYKHIYIHSATWHNNFGHVMSHGCVNVQINNAEKIFNWAHVGTIVEIIK